MNAGPFPNTKPPPLVAVQDVSAAATVYERAVKAGFRSMAFGA
jgi:hypothetical protein